MTSRCYVAQVAPRHDMIAAKALTQRAYEVFVPQAKTRHDGWHLVMPGYLFVWFDIDVDRWQTVLEAKGVVRLLPYGVERPLALREGVIEELRARLGSGALDEAGVDDWLKGVVRGQELEIVAGAYASASARAERIGRFLGRERGRVVLLMAMFGREVEVRLAPHQVALAKI